MIFNDRAEYLTDLFEWEYTDEKLLQIEEWTRWEKQAEEDEAAA